MHTAIPRVILSSVTDHYAIMCTISKIETLRTKSPVPFCRNKKDFYTEAFADKLDQFAICWGAASYCTLFICLGKRLNAVMLF